jgi:hypothetical protein
MFLVQMKSDVGYNFHRGQLRLYQCSLMIDQRSKWPGVAERDKVQKSSVVINAQATSDK